jgi:hypothetical protein
VNSSQIKLRLLVVFEDTATALCSQRALTSRAPIGLSGIVIPAAALFTGFRSAAR